MMPLQYLHPLLGDALPTGGCYSSSLGLDLLPRAPLLRYLISILISILGDPFLSTWGFSFLLCWCSTGCWGCRRPGLQYCKVHVCGNTQCLNFFPT